MPQVIFCKPFRRRYVAELRLLQSEESFDSDPLRRPLLGTRGVRLNAAVRRSLPGPLATTPSAPPVGRWEVR